MSGSNSPIAGPSRPHKTKKRSANASTPDEPIAPPSKSARIASPTGTGDDFESGDPQLGNGVDPMEALEAAEPIAEDGEEAPVLPRRADEFEQEAEREVEASKGLGGEVEEGKMKLVHQVRHQVCLKL